MIINLKQDAILEAIKAQLTNQGLNLTGKDVQIKIVAGRKGNGITAEVGIDEAPFALQNKAAKSTKSGSQNDANISVTPTSVTPEAVQVDTTANPADVVSDAQVAPEVAREDAVEANVAVAEQAEAEDKVEAPASTTSLFN